MGSFVGVVMFVAGIALGAFIYKLLFGGKSSKKVSTESAVILEKVQAVCKLVTVQGDYSEILNHSDDRSLMFGLFSQSKKALITVKAKVLVGIDLTKSKFEVDDENKVIYISRVPSAEIISVEPDIDYYDISQSTLNKFTPKELSDLNKLAVEKIRTEVNSGPLLKLAESQAHTTIDLIQNLVSISGWKVKVESAALPENKSPQLES